MIDFITAVAGGMLFTLGIIAGIGPQNLNVMSHAIIRNHELAVATTCFLADVILLLLGCFGLQLAAGSWLITVINVLGIGFLIYFLWTKLNGLAKPQQQMQFSPQPVSLQTAVVRALGLTWLNPLVFLDTIVVIGGASTHYHGWQHLAFTLGAVLGDGCWLFGLTVLTRRFANRLNQPRVWLAIDIATIVIVAYILTRMLAYFLL